MLAAALAALTIRCRCPRRGAGPAPRPARPRFPLGCRRPRPGRTFQKFHPLAAAVAAAPPLPLSHWLAAPPSSATPRPPSTADWPRRGRGAAGPPCWEGGVRQGARAPVALGRVAPRPLGGGAAPATSCCRLSPFPGGPAPPLAAASRPLARDCAVPLTAPARFNGDTRGRPPAAALRVTPPPEKALIGPRGTRGRPPLGGGGHGGAAAAGPRAAVPLRRGAGGAGPAHPRGTFPRGDGDTGRRRSGARLPSAAPGVFQVLDWQYGTYVWPCAVVLAQYLWVHRRSLPGKRVLEVPRTGPIPLHPPALRLQGKGPPPSP